MDVGQLRERYERLLTMVAAEIVGDAAEVVVKLPHRGFQARVQFTSRPEPERTALINMSAEWTEAVFVMEPNVGIAMIDDFSVEDHDAEVYTTDRMRELVTVVNAYIRGEGSIESRRTLLGKREPRLRIQAGGKEWVAGARQWVAH